MLREVDGPHTSHPTAARAAGSLTSTGTRCQSSYQVCAQPIAALPVWVAMVVLAVRWRWRLLASVAWHPLLPSPSRSPLPSHDHHSWISLIFKIAAHPKINQN